MSSNNVTFCYIYPGVEFGARMITIDGKQIKLQIWDTVSNKTNYLNMSPLGFSFVVLVKLHVSLSLAAFCDFCER